MKKKTVKGRTISERNTKGEALISKTAFMFAHGVDPKSGKIVDKKSELYEKNMKDKIFIFPNSKGSTTGSMWLLETIRRGNAPKAIINQETEMIIATGAILGDLLYHKKLSIIDRINFDQIEEIEEDEIVKVNGSESYIEYSQK